MSIDSVEAESGRERRDRQDTSMQYKSPAPQSETPSHSQSPQLPLEKKKPLSWEMVQQVKVLALQASQLSLPMGAQVKMGKPTPESHPETST